VKNPGALPLVSVVIPTFNARKTIGQCLQSVEKQTYSKLETIVVDRYSPDDTQQIVKQHQAKLFIQNSERSAAKDFGAEKAKGHFLLFVDSDMDLDPKIVEECVELCLEKGFSAAVIPEVTVADNFLAKCRKLERELYDNDPNFFLMPRFFERRSFFDVGGFDETLVCGEDFDLARRCEKRGYRIGTAMSQIRHLEGNLPLRKIVLKAHYYGKSLRSFVSKEPTLLLRGYCPTRFVWNIRSLLKHPAYSVGLAMIKLLEYTAYLAGIFTDALGRTL
jgi:glycosyltransferase involved in cell wall biosynthesis